MNLWLEKNAMEMYSTHNEGKSVVAETTKFISIWLQYQKICIFNKLDNIVNKYDNTYHSTIKLKPVDVKSSTYIDFNNKGSKFKVGDNVRMLSSKLVWRRFCDEKS